MSPPATVDFEAGAPTQVEPKAAAGCWWGLAVLILIGFFAVLDRQVFTLQIEPIRRQLQLGDLQIGLVQGLSVALFAALAGYPIGWLADRYDRRGVLIGCIVVWSLSVVGCGLAQGFGGLFVASALVGAGEAGVLPVAYALIPEWFQGRQRVTANSLLIVVTRLGIGFVIALCGYLVANVDALRPWLPPALQALETWRLAFFASALPAVPIVLLIMTIPDQRRALRRQALTPVVTPPAWPYLRSQQATFGSFYLGVGMLLFGFSALGAFLPVVAMRQMGATAVQVGNAMGTATFVASCAGLAFTTFGVRWLSGRFASTLPITMLGLATLLGAGSSALMVLAQTSNQLFVFLGLNLTCVMIGSMLFPAALQELTPQPLRARLVAIIIMVNTVFSSLSPVVVGALSDQLKPRPNGLLLAAVVTSITALLIATAALIWCGRHYPATVRAARDAEARFVAEAATVASRDP